MKGKKIEVVVYVILCLILAVFIFFAIASAFDVSFIGQLQRYVVKNTSWSTFDIYTISEWGMIITTVVLVALLVIFDERIYRKSLKNQNQ